MKTNFFYTSLGLILLNFHLFSQFDTSEKIDSVHVSMSLSYPNPKFEYLNYDVNNGILIQKIKIEEGWEHSFSNSRVQNQNNNQIDSISILASYSNPIEYVIRAEFKDSLAHGIWVAQDSNEVTRLTAHYNQGVVRKIKLFSTTGILMRLIDYENGEIVYQEWYNDGRLTQIEFKTQEGGYYISSFYENFQLQMEVFKNYESIVKKIVHYDSDGQIIYVKDY
jgi:hypothetical protein